MSRRSDKKREQEIAVIGLILFIVVLYIAFAYFQVAGFLGNCVFHWPPHLLHPIVCWHEQTAAAEQKAAQVAQPFFPQ
jgi:hypothetical protein